MWVWWYNGSVRESEELIEMINLKEKAKVIEVEIEDYKKNYPYPTLQGMLYHLNIDKDCFSYILECASLNNNQDRCKSAKRILRAVERFKNFMEMKLEEYLIYQEKHQDLNQTQFYNYKYLEFILKAYNNSFYNRAPTPYLGASQDQVNRMIQEKNGGATNKIQILENKSEIKWYK